MDWFNVISAGLSVVGGSSVLAAIIPRDTNNTKLQMAFKVLDALAANWLNARNAK